MTYQPNQREDMVFSRGVNTWDSCSADHKVLAAGRHLGQQRIFLISPPLRDGR
jgi:hypothetical protein